VRWLLPGRTPPLLAADTQLSLIFLFRDGSDPKVLPIADDGRTQQRQIGRPQTFPCSSSSVLRSAGRRERKKLHLLAVSIAKIVANFLTTGQQRRRPSKKRDIHPTTVLTTAAFAARFPPNKCAAFVSLSVGHILFSLAPV